MEIITHAEFISRLKAQGQPHRRDAAFVCPMCKTVQSMRSLIIAGALPEDAETQIGFSCIGRLTGAGSHKKGAEPGGGCNWSLGGLFRIHTLEVRFGADQHPIFEIASAEDAAKLATALKATKR
jgi:hypothetical protein